MEKVPKPTFMEKYRSDPEFKQKQLERQRQRYHENKGERIVRERKSFDVVNEEKRQRYKNDHVFRENQKQKALARYYAKKVAVDV